MKRNLNYYVEKNNDTNEIVYAEYKVIDGFKVTPKTKKEDAIEVNKIVFVSPTLTEKLIKKKIDVKIRILLQKLNSFDEEDDDSESGIRETLVEAERLKLTIINKYVKYLGEEYRKIPLKKLHIIINELRMKLFTIRENKYNDVYIEEPKKGRRGR